MSGSFGIIQSEDTVQYKALFLKAHVMEDHNRDINNFHEFRDKFFALNQ